MTNLPKLILASASPRRAEILQAVGWEFEKQIADIDETELAGESPEDYVKRLAETKALTVAQKYETAIVLGADTIVLIDGKIVGKPVDLRDAQRMLKMLSGRWHEVLTGVAIVQKCEKPKDSRPIKFWFSESVVVSVERTRVKFAELTDAEIEFLVEKGAPLDKAGAYAVQAQAALFIEKIEGDYWNVVGLPINLVYRLLKMRESK